MKKKGLKKKFNSKLVFHILPFRVYNNLFVCKRKMVATHDCCYLYNREIFKDQVVFSAVHGRLIFDCGLFENKFTDLF